MSVAANPFSVNSLRFHDEEIKRVGECQHYSYVWWNDDFFWDSTLKRPKPFLSYEAHLYAVMLILSGKTETVYVQRTQAYHKARFSKTN